jgi:hypothetical protein
MFCSPLWPTAYTQNYERRPDQSPLASGVSSLKHGSGHDVATYPCAKGRAVSLGFEGGVYSRSPASLLVGHGPEGDVFQYRVRSIMANINGRLP